MTYREQRWFCSQCYAEFDTLKQAQACEWLHAEVASQPVPTCPWCDQPGYLDFAESCSWLFGCKHFIYGMHDNDAGDVDNNVYEELCRIRGVPVLPWEYPDRRFGVRHE